jgi:hypothetical protein
VRLSVSSSLSKCVPAFDPWRHQDYDVLACDLETREFLFSLDAAPTPRTQGRQVIFCVPVNALALASSPQKKHRICVGVRLRLSPPPLPNLKTETEPVKAIFLPKDAENWFFETEFELAAGVPKNDQLAPLKRLRMERGVKVSMALDVLCNRFALSPFETLPARPQAVATRV